MNNYLGMQSKCTTQRQCHLTHGMGAETRKDMAGDTHSFNWDYDTMATTSLCLTPPQTSTQYYPILLVFLYTFKSIVISVGS